MYIKDFDNWNLEKKEIEKLVSNNQIRQAEVRWATLGVNIGSEIDGKNDGFTRPVYILEITGPDLCMVIPMSTKLKDNAGYFPIFFDGQDVSLCLHQAKVISKKRLHGRIGKVGVEKHLKITNAFQKYLSLTNVVHVDKNILNVIAKIFSTGNLDSVEYIFDNGYIDHQKPDGWTINGPEEFKQIVELARKYLPKLQVVVMDVFESGNKISGRLLWKSIDENNKKIERETVEILKVESGKVIEHWGGQVWEKITQN